MAEGFVQVAVDGIGKKIRNLLLNIAGNDVYQQVVTLADSAGAEVVPATQTTLAAVKTKTDNLDILLSALRDAIAGAGAGTKTLADVVAAVQAVQSITGTVGVSNFPADQLVHASNLDIALSLVARDATLGGLADAPGAYTVLDRLNKLGLKVDAQTKVIATEATQKQVLAAIQNKPRAAPASTLLHRS